MNYIIIEIIIGIIAIILIVAGLLFSNTDYEIFGLNLGGVLMVLCAFVFCTGSTIVVLGTILDTYGGI